MASDEGAGGKVKDQTAIHLLVEVEVEVFQQRRAVVEESNLRVFSSAKLLRDARTLSARRRGELIRFHLLSASSGRSSLCFSIQCAPFGSWRSLITP
jgi:hypothetical protein